MRLQTPPPAAYAFAYKEPPRSGNEINGLGIKERFRARPVFHGTGADQLEWSAMDRFFVLINCWPNVWHTLRNLWALRRANGPIARQKAAVEDPVAMAASVKARARHFGAGIVGIAPFTDDAQFAGRDIKYRYAICLGFPMDQRDMQYVPQKRAGIEVMRAYVRSTKTAVDLARYIRSLGWPARAYGLNCNDILQVPLSINAGLGQLGKHGSVISKEYGSNFRLSTVLTDLPLACDEPVDIGVDDLCLSCRRCTTDCPPGAIFDEKKTVRGTDKWYVDFDKCVPYFTKTFGCGICIEVCPWSDPGRGFSLSEKLLVKRKERAQQERGSITAE